jgi:hypothetical protein
MYEREGKSRVGFIAEEVREVFAHGAEAESDDFFALGIQPDSLLALTIAAVQELAARVKEPPTDDRPEPSAAGVTATVARGATAEALRRDPGRKIEILREGNKDSQHYVTARFNADAGVGGRRQAVRTFRIPNSVSRDQHLDTEFETWQRRVAG